LPFGSDTVPFGAGVRQRWRSLPSVLLCLRVAGMNERRQIRS